MATRCPACGEFIGDNTFGKSPHHNCGKVIEWNAVELASTDPRDAEIARLNALLAEARIEVGLLAAMVPARAFSKKSDAEYIEAMGERARAILAKLGA